MKPVQISNLSFSYDDKPVLIDVSADFAAGQVTTLLGPNGSGKTTLIKLLSGLLPRKAGEIYLYGKPLEQYKQKEVGQLLASVPQSTAVEFSYTVEEVVMMGRYPHLGRFQFESHEDQLIVDEAMMATNVYHFKDHLITALSGGEVQRVIIARALAQQPKILLLDEPISHLDLQHQIELLTLLKNLAKHKMLTVIVVLHDLNFAMAYSDKVLLLKNGHLMADGTVSEVITPENIETVYGVKTCLIKNPISGLPYIVPVLEHDQKNNHKPQSA